MDNHQEDDKKTTILIDFDGVLNAFPDDKAMRRGGFSDTVYKWRDDNPRRKLYAPDHAFKPARRAIIRFGQVRVRIRWSGELVSNLIDLDADWRWLSTWQPFIESDVNPALGLNGNPKVTNAQWYRYDQFGSTPIHGKEDYVDKWIVEHPGDPVIWIDDEDADSRAWDRIKQRFGGDYPILVVNPNSEIGISRPQLKLMKKFTDDHKPGVTSESWTDWDGTHLGS